MAKRRRRRDEEEGLNDEDLAILALYGKQGQQNDRTGDALRMLQLLMGQEATTAQEARLERQAQAQRLLTERGLEREEAGERRLSDIAAESKRSEEEKEKTRKAERAEAIERENARFKIEDEAKAAALEKAKKDDAIQAIDRMRAQGVIEPGEAKLRYEQIDPEFAELARKAKAQKDEATFKTKLKEYQAMNPKAQSRQKAEMYGEGGEELLQRIVDATKGYKYEEGSPSAMPGIIGKPRLEPTVSEAPLPGVNPVEQLMSPEGVRISDIFAPRVTVDPELRSGRTRTSVPAIGGATEPVTVPQGTVPPEFAYEEGYPSAQPNYNYGLVDQPVAADVINKYENDPRFKTVEQELLEGLANWWNKPRPQEESRGVGWLQ